MVTGAEREAGESGLRAGRAGEGLARRVSGGGVRKRREGAGGERPARTTLPGRALARVCGALLDHVGHVVPMTAVAVAWAATSCAWPGQRPWPEPTSSTRCWRAASGRANLRALLRLGGGLLRNRHGDACLQVRRPTGPPNSRAAEADGETESAQDHHGAADEDKRRALAHCRRPGRARPLDFCLSPAGRRAAGTLSPRRAARGRGRDIRRARDVGRRGGRRRTGGPGGRRHFAEGHGGGRHQPRRVTRLSAGGPPGARGAHAARGGDRGGGGEETPAAPRAAAPTLVAGCLRIARVLRPAAHAEFMPTPGPGGGAACTKETRRGPGRGDGRGRGRRRGGLRRRGGGSQHGDTVARGCGSFAAGAAGASVAPRPARGGTCGDPGGRKGWGRGGGARRGRGGRLDRRAIWWRAGGRAARPDRGAGAASRWAACCRGRRAGRGLGPSVGAAGTARGGHGAARQH